jgi:DNA-binding HxlR family transcriptional regulator
MAPQRPVDFWLKLVDDLINDHFGRALDEHGITRRQWEVMNLLTKGPAAHDELEEVLAPFPPEIEPSALTEELGELVESGWLVRQEEEYALTERGQTSYERLEPVLRATDEEIARDISAADYATMLRVLEQMAVNLGWRESTPPGA